MRLDTALWRAIAVFRLAALVYAVGSAVVYAGDFRRPRLAVLVLVLMAGWTALTAYLYGQQQLRRWPLVSADLAVTVAALLSSRLVLTADAIAAGDPTLTVSWAAAPVLAWAVWSGWVGGLCAGAVVAGGAVLERSGAAQATVNSIVLLLLVGAVVGYVVQLARHAEAAYAQAVSLQAATAERDRLARSVHDGVLQVLALVSRQGDPQLAPLAAEQEVSLRRLVSTQPAAAPAGTCDLVALLPVASDVEVISPGRVVSLPTAVAAELAAAVSAAVDNARRHGGGHAWVLVDDELDSVTVTVRDAGAGIVEGRLAEAETEGRLGMAQSIRGRLRDLGGSVAVLSPPGQGTEVELRVPR